MMVMMMAMTPSLNAARRSFPMRYVSGLIRPALPISTQAENISLVRRRKEATRRAKATTLASTAEQIVDVYDVCTAQALRDSKELLFTNRPAPPLKDWLASSTALGIKSSC
jgi:hypothetical protein